MFKQEGMLFMEMTVPRMKSVKREYDEFKVRINSLPKAIRRLFDAYNAHEELRAKKKQMELGGSFSDLSREPGVVMDYQGMQGPEFGTHHFLGLLPKNGILHVRSSVDG